MRGIPYGEPECIAGRESESPQEARAWSREGARAIEQGGCPSTQQGGCPSTLQGGIQPFLSTHTCFRSSRRLLSHFSVLARPTACSLSSLRHHVADALSKEGLSAIVRSCQDNVPRHTAILTLPSTSTCFRSLHGIATVEVWATLGLLSVACSGEGVDPQQGLRTLL